MIADSNLHEVLLQGYPFTWERGRGTANWVQESLDWAFVYESWLSIFPLCKLSNLIAVVSDHSWIILYIEVREYFLSKMRLKVENALLKEADFQQTVIHNWEATKGRHVMYRLDNCSSTMDTWGRNFVRQFRNQISECQRQLIMVLGDASVTATEEAMNLCVQLSKLLIQEEQY